MNFFNIVESGLGTPSDNSLRTLEGISLGPRDLYIFRFLRRSWNFSSLRVGRTLFSQSPSCCPFSWDLWEEGVAVKREAKKLLSTSDFPSWRTDAQFIVFPINIDEAVWYKYFSSNRQISVKQRANTLSFCSYYVICTFFPRILWHYDKAPCSVFLTFKASTHRPSFPWKHNAQVLKAHEIFI